MHQNTYRKGFTLVELIVVIAIIAILAAVSIVGFSTYIENARMSNDNSAATQMTNVLSAHFITNNDENLEAHDVRDIVEEINGGPFDWTPQSSNAGFFYIPEDRKIIAAKFEDIIEPGFVLSTSGETRLLSGTNLAVSTGEPGNTPEEFFSEGAHLLTVSGNVVADVVTGIRALTSSNNIEDDYEALSTAATNATTGFSGWFGSRGDVAEIVEDFLYEYDPVRTLYVNNNRWLLMDEYQDSANLLETTIDAGRIVYKPGITSIPSFPNTGAYVNISRIFIPNSVRYIQENAFTKFVDLNAELVYSSSLSVQVDSNAFSTQFLSRIAGESAFTVGITTVNQIDELDILDGAVPKTVLSGQNVELTGESFTVDVTSIPSEISSMMTNLSVSSKNGEYKVVFYGDSGILAEFSFTSYQYLVSFNENGQTVDPVQPTQVVQLNGYIDDPEIDDIGWALTPAGTPIDFGTFTVTKNTVLYAIDTTTP